MPGAKQGRSGVFMVSYYALLDLATCKRITLAELFSARGKPPPHTKHDQVIQKLRLPFPGDNLRTLLPDSHRHYPLRYFLEPSPKKSKHLGFSRGALRSFAFFVIPVVEIFFGSPENCDPGFIYFKIDEILPNWPGGSETSITSSSFAFKKPRLRLRCFYHNTTTIQKVERK